MAKKEREAFVLAAFRGQGRGRSGVYAWMSERYEALAEAKASGSRVDWVGVTAELVALGYKARGGLRLKPNAVRRTWQRVESDQAKVAAVAARVKANARRSGMVALRLHEPVPFPTEALQPEDDDFELHDVMGRPIVGPPDDDDDFRTLSGRPI